MNNYFMGTEQELVTDILYNSENRVYYGVNTDCYLLYQRNHDYRRVLNSNGMKYTDGAGIIIGSKILKEEVPAERISTTDLFPALLSKISKLPQPSKFKIFLLGGRPGVAEQVVNNMQQQYHVEFVGVLNGYDLDEKSTINQINDSGANILFVGFGAPRQEIWVDEHQNQIQCAKIITCGGLFDYYSNRVKRAPQWMQDAALEWLFRLAQEPTRLAKRYLIGNPLFLFNMIVRRLRGERMWK